ncbi:isoquinoline 1-oxidoreductase alpha subunit [Tenacibaculum skagerrakense]|uniref:Isoquinoline 1-oxidoreductase alpha subunit n=1 Tax=Tenacibaculum skagerrakense TaxID=186571 RepID=A0A4R2NN18_9FLAO|nr:(2Fe-2S)-binding protein [Tenacibaculum skagerrakense]TCP22654.1 isoquinoline 1-oxidoreductase alpha subunit [Tenacibaculum skagerrakense]
MPTYNLKINGELVTVTADSDTPLLWILRDKLNLVGTKFGCGIAQCGACTVHVDGVATRSCQLQISLIDKEEITTIEGLSKDGNHPLQEAWEEVDVPQCGYCQAGQIMTAASFLKENPNPTTQEIREAMHGNLCRCASYNRIEKAVAKAATKMS